jgi:L-ribulokinase
MKALFSTPVLLKEIRWFLYSLIYGYEAGQSAVGDIFEWYAQDGVPVHTYREAEAEDMNIYDYLESKAARLKPGESGLLALDWWNGNRSVLVDADLTGLIMGMDLNTGPVEIYRTLVEATAFGTILKRHFDFCLFI